MFNMKKEELEELINLLNKFEVAAVTRYTIESTAPTLNEHKQLFRSIDYVRYEIEDCTEIAE